MRNKPSEDKKKNPGNAVFSELFGVPDTLRRCFEPPFNKVAAPGGGPKAAYANCVRTCAQEAQQTKTPTLTGGVFLWRA